MSWSFNYQTVTKDEAKARFEAEPQRSHIPGSVIAVIDGLIDDLKDDERVSIASHGHVTPAENRCIGSRTNLAIEVVTTG